MSQLVTVLYAAVKPTHCINLKPKFWSLLHFKDLTCRKCHLSFRQWKRGSALPLAVSTELTIQVSSAVFTLCLGPCLPWVSSLLLPSHHLLSHSEPGRGRDTLPLREERGSGWGLRSPLQPAGRTLEGHVVSSSWPLIRNPSVSTEERTLTSLPLPIPLT